MSKIRSPLVSMAVADVKRTLSLLLLVVAAQSAAADDWPTFQHDNRRSGASSEQLDAASLTVRWVHRPAHPPQSAWAGPAKWDAYAGIRGLRSMRNYDPVFHVIAVGDAVYYGSSVDDSVHRLDKATGNPLWSYTTDGPVRIAPSYVDGRLIFGSDDGYAYAIDAEDGEMIWKFRPHESDQTVINNGRIISFWPCRSGVPVDQGTAYCAHSLLPWKESYLSAVDAETGRPEGEGRFVQRLDEATMEGPLVISPRRLIVPQGRVEPRLFARGSGQLLGSLEGGGGCFVVLTPDERILHGPGNKTGWITGSDSASREKIASYPGGNAIVVSGTVSYLLRDDALIASDFASRKHLWTVPCDYPLALILAGDTLFVGGEDGIAAFRTSDGSQVWKHPVEGSAYGLAAAAGSLLVSTDTGAIYSFSEGESGAPAPNVAIAAEESDESESAGPLAAIEKIADRGLLGRWVFQRPHVKGPTASDLAAGLDATISGRVRLERVGQHQGLLLDGVTHSVMVRPDHTQARLPRQRLSAAAWVRVDRPLAWGGIIGAVQDNGDYERGWLLGYNDTKFSFAVSGTKGNGRLTYLTAEEDFETGRWYHIVGAYDGRQMQLYVNGKLAAGSDEQQGDINYPPQAFFEIGAYHDKDEYFRHNGMVHEVRLYSRALTADEVRSQYQHKVSRFPAPAPVLERSQVAAGPWLKFAAPDEAVVRWHTQRPMPSIIEFGPTDGRRERVENMSSKTSHELTLTGLERNRHYSYVIKTINDGTEKATEEFECDNFFNYRGLHSVDQPSPYSDDGATVAARQAAEQALKTSGVDQGICVVIGCHEGRLAYELARESRFRVIAFDTDIRHIQQARRLLTEAGVYGARVSVHQVESLDRLPVPSCFANLVVSGDMLAQGRCTSTPTEIYRILRPAGGVACLGQPAGTSRLLKRQELSGWLQDAGVKFETVAADGIWAKIVRPALTGAGEWSHLYGSADNSAFGGESLAGATQIDDLQVQWLGRPGARYQPDRNGRKPAPLSTGGRLFLQGLHRMIALDAFNGTILWSLEIPDLQRFNMPRDCGNWCADKETVYAAIRDKCWRIDARTGRVADMIPVSKPTENQGEWDWGYLAVSGDQIIGSAVKQGTSWTNFWGNATAGWYDSTEGPVTHKVSSDHLFAVDKRTGQSLWKYEDGVIINSTVTIGDGNVCFIETRHPRVRASQPRRVGMPEMWQEQYLVALDVETGEKQWEQPIDTADGTVVFFMAHGHGRLVVVASTGGKYHVACFAADGGRQQWTQSFDWPSDNHGGHMARPAMVGDNIFLKPRALQLATGKLLDKQMPVGKCGTYAATAHALFYRTSNVTMWDQQKAEVTSWSRLRPDCWLSTIPAAGMLLSPEGGGGCSCGSWMETSVGFLPRKIQ